MAIVMAAKHGVRRKTPSKESPRRKEGILPNSAATQIRAYT